MIRQLKIICTFVFFFLALTTMGCSSNTGYITNNKPMISSESSKYAQLAEELQKEHLTGTFDGTVIISSGGQVLFSNSFGYANRQSLVLNAANSISDIGSIAKTFTAAAILNLISENTLSLTDTLDTFYPDLPDTLQMISIEQLLTHTSGLDNFHNNSDFETMNKSEAEQKILSMPLIATPGKQIAYSNAAYTLLATILEKVTGVSFQEYIQRTFLTPLDLKDTGFYRDQTISSERLSRGYGGDDSGQTTYDKGLTWALVGAGGMVSSANDLTLWFNALNTGLVTSQSGTNLVFQLANTRWLLGSFSNLSINGNDIIQMGGSTDFGYTALLQYIPSKNVLITLVLNGHNHKYANATHHHLSRKHILPIILE